MKLYKPLISLSTDKLHKPHHFPSRKWLACYFLSAIENTGARKFHGTQHPIETWVFSPNVRYASSVDSPSPTTAVKILYRAVTEAQQRERDSLVREQLHVHELGLPLVLEEELIGVLAEANGELPSELRVFQEWNVALLPRFSQADLSP